MGSVYLVNHQSLGSELALKVLARGSAMHHARFGREARILASLRSEHVAKVVDFGFVDQLEAPYMVMEYLPGLDLSQVLETSEPLRPKDAVDHVLEACEALAEAHAEGIIHRDIKPSNLFLTTRFDGSPMVKVLDFGIAKTEASQGDDTSLTATTMVFGSPAYMSPEQVRSSKQVGPQTDIWSLAMVLYELVSKRHPFLGDSTAGIVAAIAADPPLPLPLDIGPNLWAVLEPALKKDPRERPQTIAVFARSLAPFATERGRIVLARIERLANRSVPGFEERQTHAMISSNDLAVANSTKRSGNDGPPASSRTTHGGGGPKLGALPLVLAGLAIVGIGAWVGMRSRSVFSGTSTAPIESSEAVDSAVVSVPSVAPAVSVAPVASVAPTPSGSAVPSAATSTPSKGRRPSGRPAGSDHPAGPTAPRQGEFN